MSLIKAALNYCKKNVQVPSIELFKTPHILF